MVLFGVVVVCHCALSVTLFAFYCHACHWTGRAQDDAVSVVIRFGGVITSLIVCFPSSSVSFRVLLNVSGGNTIGSGHWVTHTLGPERAICGIWSSCYALVISSVLVTTKIKVSLPYIVMDVSRS